MLGSAAVKEHSNSASYPSKTLYGLCITDITSGVYIPEYILKRQVLQSSLGQFCGFISVNHIGIFVRKINTTYTEHLRLL